MDKEVKTKWVKALRSGRYKQASYTLLDEDGRSCCLGVLARVQGAKKQEILHSSFLEDDLSKYAAGLSKKTQARLARLNDSVCMDFKAIAKDIEQRY